MRCIDQYLSNQSTCPISDEYLSASDAIGMLGSSAPVPYGLVSACRNCLVDDLDRTAALVMFAAGRVAGWLAHALQRKTHGALI